nr:LysR family transcriptional regulator [Mesorhizobium sp. WSM4875]
MRRLPSLRAVHYFESAARNLSFTRAADELNVTQAAVSHQIRYLEEELGVKLFTRTHQRIDLTPEGVHLLETATDVLDKLGDTLASIAVQSPYDRLHIGVTPLFSAYWLMPRLSQFTNARKHTEIVLHHSLEPPHERLDRTSVKIFWGGEVSGYERDELFTDYLVPMCSKNLFETMRGKTVQEVMATANFIHEFDREWWTSWCRSEGIDPNVIQKGTIVDDPGVLESAAVLGHGMVLGSITFLKRRIDAGEIVVPFGIRSPIEIRYCMLTKPAEMKRRAVREFRNWILAAAAEEKSGAPPVIDACIA